MNISLPKGYRPPEGVEPGTPFEVVAVLVPEKDGSFSVKSLDGVKLDEEKEDESDDAMDPFELARKDENPDFLAESY